MKKYLYVENTKYTNLANESLTLIMAFMDDYNWTLTKEKTADILIDLENRKIVIYGKVFPIEISEYGVKKSTKISLYKSLNIITGRELCYGILQGMRPTKLVRKLFLQGMSEQEVIQKLNRESLVKKETAKLLVDIFYEEKKYLEKNLKKSASIYIGIPFCPSKCSYCSFPSYVYDEKMISKYLDALIIEIKAVLPKLIKRYDLKTLYVGGGTPTTLNSIQLKTLLQEVDKIKKLNTFKEVTVEAGRPDTITKEKLEVLKDMNVGRISINPQTMNQKTLDIIKRKSTVKELKECYEMAKKIGFKDINMDLIVGLTGETEKEANYTVKEVMKLNPTQITVHTLALKHKSHLNQHKEEMNLTSANIIDKMNNVIRKEISKKYKPYYLYRQKNMLSSGENIGYYRKNGPCIYNIEIIEENSNIVAFGAGSCSKYIYNNKIKRIENVKNVTEYIKRVDEMVKRKEVFIND